MISERFNFWMKKTPPWPREGRWGEFDLVFIPRAFNLIGTYLFKDEWRGIEGYAEPEPSLPENQSGATTAQLDLAEMALTNNHPGYKGRRPPSLPALTRIGGLGGLGGMEVATLPSPELPLRFHYDDWVEAVRIVGGWVALRDKAIERRRAVVEWLTARIADDKTLRVVLRHTQSGDQIAGPVEHWNGHWYQFEGRWRRGSYFLEAPFARPGISRREWNEAAIFVVEADLIAVLASKKPDHLLHDQAPVADGEAAAMHGLTDENDAAQDRGEVNDPGVTKRRGEKSRNITAALEAEFGADLGHRDRDWARALRAVDRWSKKNSDARITEGDDNRRRRINDIWNNLTH